MHTKRSLEPKCNALNSKVMRNSNKSKKILALFLVLLMGFGIFLAVMFYTAVHERDIPSIYSEETAKAQRGNIISADGFHITATQKPLILWPL